MTMAEVVGASKEGRLLECFGSNTDMGVGTITPVASIDYKGESLSLPAVSKESLSAKLHKQLTDIEYGNVASPWSVKIN